MISINFDAPSRAVARTGSHGIAAMCGAMRMAVQRPAGDPAPAMRLEHVMRQRRLAWPWSEQQGRSVFTGTGSIARKVAAHPRKPATSDGYVVLIDDVWGPDPWRPHPV